MARRVRLEQPTDPQQTWGTTQRALDQLGQFVDEAEAYVPASSSDWSGSPPATVKAALDRIAAALGPIA